MPSQTHHYMPVLRWKRGEFDALRSLFQPDRAAMIPMVEMLDDTVDFDTPTLPGAQPDVEVAVTRLARVWGTTPIFIDTQALDVQTPPSPHPVLQVFAAARSSQVAAVPVATLEGSVAFTTALAQTIRTDGRGCAIRVSPADITEPTFQQELMSLLGTLGVREGNVDLVLDWGAIPPDSAAPTSLAVAGVVTTVIPTPTAWRSIVFVASSFPDTLAAAGVGQSTILRAEWATYRRLLSSSLPRAIAFGDYAIAYPIYTSVPFVGSAAIRYTIDDDWLIVRGRSLKGPVYGGYGQYPVLCRTLSGTPHYRGAGFSWGDQYIDDCATGRVGTGGQTTWRAVGTNHHITFVNRQLASYRAPSTGHVPPHVGP